MRCTQWVGKEHSGQNVGDIDDLVCEGHAIRSAM
jgi:hypothetical protein